MPWFTLSLISCSGPSGCCRDGSTRPCGMGRERAAAHRPGNRASPKHGTRRLAGDLLPRLCGVLVPFLSPAQRPHVPLVVSQQHPYFPCSMCKGEEQSRAIPSLQLPFPLLPITVASGHIMPIFISHPAYARLCLSSSKPPQATHVWAGGCDPLGSASSWCWGYPAALPYHTTTNTFLCLKGGGFRCYQRRSSTNPMGSQRGS